MLSRTLLTFSLFHLPTFRPHFGDDVCVFPRHLTRHLLPALLAVPLVLVGLVTAASRADALDGVYPVLNCVSYDAESNQVTAHFGYDNVNDGAQFIPVGGTNYFFPLGSDQGQPTSFATGRHDDVFTVTWSLDDSRAVTWYLLGLPTTASLDSVNCTGQATTPSIHGLPAVGQRLTVDVGHVLPAAITSYDDPQVTWTRDCEADAAVAIGTGDDYVVQAADAGHRIGATVVWTESGTTADDEAAALTATTACGSDALAGEAPSASRTPYLVGDDIPGSTLSIAGAAWSGTAPITEEVRWERCSTTTCTSLGAAATYAVVSDDVGYQVRAVVTASNPWGTASQVTPAVTVAAPPAPPAPAGSVTVSSPALTLRGRVHRLGRAATVRVDNSTTASVVVGPAMLAGPQRRAFRITGGTCATLTTLGPSSSCTVKVALKAPKKRVRRATLRIPVDKQTPLQVALVGRPRR